VGSMEPGIELEVIHVLLQHVSPPSLAFGNLKFSCFLRHELTNIRPFTN
jgi:hypothetical protein